MHTYVYVNSPHISLLYYLSHFWNVGQITILVLGGSQVGGVLFHLHHLWATEQVWNDLLKKSKNVIMPVCNYHACNS